MLAGDLAESRRARLAVIEEPGFPLQASFSRWLSEHGPHDETSRRIERAQALEAAASDVLWLRAEVTDEAAMQRAFAQATERFGRIDGVIYAASGLREGDLMTIQDADPGACARCFAPRIRGIEVLAEVLRDHDVGVCFVVSSLSSVLGGVGQVAHAAASHFMDAFAEQQSEAGPVPWISVDWDAWLLDEGPSIAALGAARSGFAILPAEGIEAARRILASSPAGRVVVSTIDLVERERRALARPPASSSAVSGEATLPRHPRPALGTPYVPPRTDLEKVAVAVWQKVLGVDAVGIDDHFFELGGHSLLAVQAMAELERAAEVEVPVATLYQRPTIRALAELLSQSGDQAHRARAEKLARRKDELARRNLWLHKRQR